MIVSKIKIKATVDKKEVYNDINYIDSSSLIKDEKECRCRTQYIKDNKEKNVF